MKRRNFIKIALGASIAPSTLKLSHVKNIEIKGNLLKTKDVKEIVRNIPAGYTRVSSHDIKTNSPVTTKLMKRLFAGV